MTQVYWTGEIPKIDDLGGTIESKFYDGRTWTGPWGIMNPENWKLYGCGKLGTGHGQKYEKQSDGRWLKTGG